MSKRIIVVHIDSQADTATLIPAYDGLEGTILYNPDRKDVIQALQENPDDLVMFLGHGGPSGLFSKDWRGLVFDTNMVEYLNGREVIGIWCHASDFAKDNGLKGFFTSMFISNKSEARAFGYDATDEVCFEQNRLFATMVNELIKAETPLSEWPDILRSKADMSIGFVNYNYTPLAYFDGTQRPDWETDNFTDWYLNEFSVTEEENADSHYFIGKWFDELLAKMFDNPTTRTEIMSEVLEDVIDEIESCYGDRYTKEDVEEAARKILFYRILY